MGEITFTYRGMMRLYSCSCDNPEPEPSEMGVQCWSCGARAMWPEPPQEYTDNYNRMFDELMAQAQANAEESD